VSLCVTLCARSARRRRVACALSHGCCRTYHLRVYPNVFLGSDAVAFMVREQMAPTRQSAVTLGQAMLDGGLLHHVVRA
jgi:hypothetical protein